MIDGMNRFILLDELDTNIEEFFLVLNGQLLRIYHETHKIFNLILQSFSILIHLRM